VFYFVKQVGCFVTSPKVDTKGSLQSKLNAKRYLRSTLAKVTMFYFVKQVGCFATSPKVDTKGSLQSKLNAKRYLRSTSAKVKENNNNKIKAEIGHII
jgi:hypothetical protein